MNSLALSAKTLKDNVFSVQPYVLSVFQCTVCVGWVSALDSPSTRVSLVLKLAENFAGMSCIFILQKIQPGNKVSSTWQLAEYSASFQTMLNTNSFGWFNIIRLSQKYYYYYSWFHLISSWLGERKEMFIIKTQRLENFTIHRKRVPQWGRKW